MAGRIEGVRELSRGWMGQVDLRIDGKHVNIGTPTCETPEEAARMLDM